MATVGNSTHIIPQFNGENFDFWSIKFKAIMKAFGLWEIIETGVPTEQVATEVGTRTGTDQDTPAAATAIGPAAGSTTGSTSAGSSTSTPQSRPLEQAHLSAEQKQELGRKDADALAKIFSAVSDSIFPRIMGANTAKEAWEILKLEFQGTEKIRTLRLQTLRRTFESMQMKENESIQSYSTRFSEVVSQMKILGENITSQRQVEKLLVSLTDKFDVTVGIIEQTKDLATLSPTELIGSLQAYEQRQTSRAENVSEGALQARHFSKNMKMYKKHAKKQVVTGGTSEAGGNEAKRFPTCGICGKSNHLEKKCWKRGKPKCNFCNKFGHLERDCRTKKASQEGVIQQSNLVESGLVEEHLFMASHNNVDADQGIWVIDSGCTSHMTSRREFFSQLDTSIQVPVKLANGSFVHSKGRGSIIVETNKGTRVIKDVLYVPELDQNLVSVPQMMENGYELCFKNRSCVILDALGCNLATIEMKNKSFLLEWKNLNEMSCRTQGDDKSMLWHRRFGHCGLQGLSQLTNMEMVRDMPKLNYSKHICEECQLGKMPRQPFPDSSSWRAQQKLELVHSDLCGPMRTPSLEGSLYFALFIDDYSRMAWVYFIKEKSELFRVFKEFKSKAEAQSECSLKCIRTDNGKEYTSKEFDNFCRDHGVRHQLTVPYSPQQNGVCERRNRSVMNMVRAMLIQKKMPQKFWAEAVNTAIYLQNRYVTKALDDKTPYEAWNGHKPSVKHLRVFGSICYYHVPNVKRTKLDPKAEKAIFVGYSPQAKGYRLFSLKNEKIVVSRDVIFDEEAVLDWKDESVMNESVTLLKMFQVQGTSAEVPDLQDQSGNAGNSNMEPASSLPGNSSGSSSEVSGDPSNSQEGSSNSSPLRYRNLSSIYEQLQSIQECNQVETDPSYFEEAACHEHWRAAMKEEIGMINKNETWTLVERPAGKDPIGVKWVYKTKLNPDGSIQKHKARLVVKGYSQQFGVDYSDTFAPVSRLDTVRTILALAACKKWSVFQLDVKSAFLNGWLNEEIYVEQPQGFEIAGQEDKVLKLRKALYGLKQAPRAWYSRIDDHFTRSNLVKSSSEHTLYTRCEGSAILIVSLYVDDLIVTGNSETAIQKFKEEMMKVFEMTDLGRMRYFLGIEVHQVQEGIFICQEKYAKSLLKKFNMEKSKAVISPLVQNSKLQKIDGSAAADASMFRSIIGSLLYLSATRPDITHATSLLSRFMQNPSELHLKAAKRILRFVQGTCDYGIMYKAGGNSVLTGFSDSDWGGSVDDLKSTTGYLFKIGSGAIAWSSHKQETVAQSTAEAEYIAGCAAVNQAIWLRRIMQNLSEKQVTPTTIFCDNKSAIAIAKNPVMHRRTKHIQIKYHFVREAENAGEINLVFCPSEEQLADMFTKGLTAERFKKLSKGIGICKLNIKEEN